MKTGILSTSLCDDTLVSTPSPPPVTFCHKKYDPLPPSEHDVIYEWPLIYFFGNLL